ncbi:angiopoietin-related protein 7-like [Palaemon carinicauda]|uniref:angiopoietin-related protein 7-like n=1 Tax=Palaemon carinicauda TaxID=392227 RepID=UPI0035B66C88
MVTHIETFIENSLSVIRFFTKKIYRDIQVSEKQKMEFQNVFVGLLFYLLGDFIIQTACTRRGRCEEKAALHSDIRNFHESQEILRGEVANLKDALASLSSLLAYSLPEDCSAAKDRGSWTSTTMIKPPGLPPRLVRCEQREQGGGWTIILARKPTANPINFNTTWQNYKEGFGEIDEEFWIGNEVLHRLTREVPHKLRVVFTDWNDTKQTAIWNLFMVGNEDNHYRLSIDEYSADDSTARDELKIHNGRSFSTHDYDNDIDAAEHCAKNHGGGWWYFQCYTANPTGKILTPYQGGDHGMVWGVHATKTVLKSMVMMIKPTSPASYH